MSQEISSIVQERSHLPMIDQSLKVPMKLLQQAFRRLSLKEKTNLMFRRMKNKNRAKEMNKLKQERKG